ncbi:MAG: PAS domain S-box protein [Candidatus Omnitrophota bacterium]
MARKEKTKEELAKEVKTLRSKITELETAQSVYKQEARSAIVFKTIIDKANYGIVISDMDGNLVHVNDVFAKMHGYSPEEVVGENLSSFHDTEQLKDLTRLDDMLKRKGSYAGEEVWHKKKDGTLFPTMTSAMVIKNEKGKPLFASSTVIDTTDNKLAEDALKESEEKWRSMAKNAPGIIMILDREGRIQFINHTVRGLKIKDVIGEKHDKYVEPEHRNTVNKALEKVFWTGKSGSYEIEGTGPSGTKAWYSTLVGPIKQNGQVVAVTVFVTDITERRRAIEQIIHLNETFLGLGADHDKNIEILTRTCGEVLGGTCALYNRIKKGLLCSVGEWHTPRGYDPVDKPKGHICYDVIKKSKRGAPYVVKNLQKSSYRKSDPNVSKYGLETYIGFPVYCSGESVGSLCVVYQKDTEFSEGDKKLMGVIAEALSREEDRWKAESELKESEEKFKAIFDHAVDGILLADLENKKFFDGNKTICKMLGYSADEIRKLEVSDIHPKEDLLRVIKQFEKQTREEVTLAQDIPVKRRDGSVFYADVNSKPVMIGGRKYLVGIFRDVTERKEAEKALRQSEEKYRLITENTSDLIAVMEFNGTYRYVSPSHRQLGHEPEDLVGKSGLSMMHPDDRKNLLPLMKKYGKAALKSMFEKDIKDVYEHIEFRLPDRKGNWRNIESTVNLIKSADARKKYDILIISRDVTDRKKAELELEKQRKVLDETNKELFEKLDQLQKAMGHIKRLEGLVPICAKCKKIRIEGIEADKPEAWVSLEKYISDKTEASLTHGLCPECAKKLYKRSRGEEE